LVPTNYTDRKTSISLKTDTLYLAETRDIPFAMLGKCLYIFSSICKCAVWSSGYLRVSLFLKLEKPPPKSITIADLPTLLKFRNQAGELVAVPPLPFDFISQREYFEKMLRHFVYLRQRCMTYLIPVLRNQVRKQQLDNLQHFVGEEDQALVTLREQLKLGRCNDIGVFCDDDDGESEVDPEDIRPDYKTATIVRVENMHSEEGKVGANTMILRQMIHPLPRSIGTFFWREKTKRGVLKVLCEF
jgi:hypothetical protein